jgi:lipopolysaccharide heptosyltransferase I
MFYPTGWSTKKLDPKSVRRILVIRTSALGDVLHVLPALAALRQQFPGARVSWFVEPLGGAILEGHPDIDDLIVFNRKRWTRSLRSPWKWGTAGREFAALTRRFRSHQFDLVIDFQNNFRSGLATLLSGGRWRLCFHASDCREFGGWVFANLRAPPCPLLEPRVLKNLHLIRSIGFEGPCPTPVLPLPEVDRVWAREEIASIPGDGPLVTVHPAVSKYGLLKQWPAVHFNTFIRELTRRRDVRVVVSWGPGELELAGDVARGTSAVVAPPTDRLLRLAALIDGSQLLVAGDTGCLHLAAALNVPVLGLYGPKSPFTYGPFPNTGRVVHSEVPCSPCNLRRCEHRICMDSMLPERVAEEAIAVLDETAVSAST